MDYKPTLRLPRTSFPMKADLPVREPEVQARWEKEGLYALLRKARAGAPKYVFHDGPPYANGDVHVGLSMNKILKDFVVRSRSMMGLDAPFVPGWDCHGLPIENHVMKEAGKEARTLSPSEIRSRCRKYAERFLDHQRAQFRRLGCLGDWDRPYATMTPEYEDGVLSVFERMLAMGYVARDKRSTAWCPNCATALAEAELEYRDKESPSIYVRCVVGTPSPALGKAVSGEVGLVVWTTTPWTLPANLAIAVHPDLEYTVFSATVGGAEGRLDIVASARLEAVAGACGMKDVRVLAVLQGRDLVGTTYRHPLSCPEPDAHSPPATGGPPLDAQPVVAAAYVSAGEGTGCVHTAPGHGADDFRTGKENGLPPFSPLDDHGRYTAEAGQGLAGKRVPDEANGAVLPLLGARLLHEEKVLHSYAHCWRCHRPIVYRATDQWFVQVDHLDLRKRALEEVGRVRWVPEWGARRISGMLASRPDWCISRQRHWGIPIPALRCAGCDHVWTSTEIVSRTREVVRREGADSWFDRPVHAIVGSQACPACGGREAVPARDIFDVWFESGTSWRAVVQREGLGLGFPSDAVLEGTDQHRGWFQSSLLPAVAVEGRAPWRTVVTHGFIVDEGGDKVSKSKGGMLHADVLAREFGADVARLWVASIEYREDAPVSRDLLRRTGEVYRRIRNTFRWLLGNLDGFDPARDAVPDGDLLEADRWVLARLDRVAAEYVEAFGAFDWARGLRAVHEFCDRDLSAFWFDANKDRFYCDEADGPRRRSGRTAAWRLADSLCRLLAPVLPHTMEEVWGALPGARGGSVHLETWPAPAAAAPDAGALLARWEDLRRLRDAVLAACEPLRARKEIGSNLEARVAIAADAAVPGMGPEELAEVLMVSEVVPGEPAAGGGAPVVATPSPHPRCARCWNLRPGVGRDSRFPDLCGRCAAVVGSGAPAAPSGG